MNTLRTELIRYFDQLGTDVHFAFMEVQRDVRKGTIHSLRVALKRLRAFLQMWDQIDPYFRGKASIKRLKPLFREAGRLRDLQIESSLLAYEEDTLQLGHQASDQLRICIFEQQKTFEAFQQAFSLACIRETCMQARSHIAHIGAAGLRKGVRKYFHDMLDEVAALAHEGLSSKKRLHQLRKKIKEAHYNIIAIDTATPHLDLPMDVLKPLETLQHQLGAWHDHRITVAESKNLWNVPPSLKKQLREEEKRSLEDIRRELAQLPGLTGRLLDEMDVLLRPQKAKKNAKPLTS